jgi:hypothetical protein
MRGKTLAFLLLTLAIVTVAGVFLIRSRSYSPSDGPIGAPLLQDLRVNDITAVQLKSAQGSAALTRKDDRWVVEDRHDYPADFSKLSQMVRQLKDLKVGRQFEGSEEILKRLELTDPGDLSAGEGQGGLRVLLKDKGGAVLADIRLGKLRVPGDERGLPDGQYVRMGDDSSVFLVDRALNGYSSDPASWLEKKLIEVPAADVKRISCTNAKGDVLYAFERTELGKDFAPLVQIPKARDLDRGSLKRVSGGLSSLRLEDVAEGGQGFDEKASLVLTYQLFSGMIYRVYPDTACQNDNRCPIRIRAEYHPVAESPGSKVEAAPTPDGKPSSSPAPSPEEMASSAKSLNSRFTPWVFYLPKWQRDNFLTSLEQLLKKPEEKTPPKSQ